MDNIEIKDKDGETRYTVKDNKVYDKDGKEINESAPSDEGKQGSRKAE